MSQPTVSIAVDARPLRHPNSGIGKYTKKLLEYLAQQPDVHLVLLGRQRTHGRVQHVFETLWALLAFGLIARRHRVDVYWSPRHHLPLGLGKVVSVVTIHDVVYKVQPRTMPFFNWLIEALLMPRSVRRANRIIVPSVHTQNDVLNFFAVEPEKVCLIAMGAQDKQLTPAQAGTPTFLFVGGDQPRKNLPLCLAAAALLDAQDHSLDWRLCVAGFVSERDKLMRHIEQKRLSHRVELLGELSENELEQHYADCHVLLMPSLHEGFGLPVLEAARYGKPAIVTADTALEEFSKGIVTVALDDTRTPARDRPPGENMAQELMAQQMYQLLADKQHYADLARLAQASTERLTWSATGATSLHLFRQLHSTGL